jgi:hypothetical protein
VFDPTRDEVAARPYAVRLGLIVLTAFAIGIAVMPLLMGYSAGSDGTTTCVAIRDAWSGRAAPPIPGPAPVPPAYANITSAQRAIFQKQMAAYLAQPDVKAAEDYSTWLDGPGACSASARHRLMLSAVGLGAIGVVGFTTFIVGATRRRLVLNANEPASLTSA